MARSYDDETKAAVLAALLEGQAVSYVAEQYDIPRSTISTWKRRELGSISETVALQKKEELGDLILDLLRIELQTLKTMSSAFADKAWLQKQSASETAVLYGVIQDKVFRKLEALTRHAAHD